MARLVALLSAAPLRGAAGCGAALLGYSPTQAGWCWGPSLCTSMNRRTPPPGAVSRLGNHTLASCISTEHGHTAGWLDLTCIGVDLGVRGEAGCAAFCTPVCDLSTWYHFHDRHSSLSRDSLFLPHFILSIVTATVWYQNLEAAARDIYSTSHGLSVAMPISPTLALGRSFVRYPNKSHVCLTLFCLGRSNHRAHMHVFVCVTMTGSGSDAMHLDTDTAGIPCSQHHVMMTAE